MHDLVFTRPGDRYPFDESVDVAWDDGIFEFRLHTGQTLIAADRSHEDAAPDVLSAFLSQLVGDS